MRLRNLNLLLAGIILCSGCAAMKTRLGKHTLPAVASKNVSAAAQKSADAEPKPLPEFQTPEKMLAIWKDSVRTEDNGLSMRGFGGRLYLYDDDGMPIRAEGDLIIYGFDDSVTDREGSKADRKIVIQNEQFQKRYSESALGPSYSVWVSWDRVGSVDKSVTLVPFFRTSDGNIVQAGQSIYTLHTSGNKSDTLDRERVSSFKQVPPPNAAEGVAQVSYLEGSDVGDQSLSTGPRVRTTTISLPRETQKRLLNSNFGLERRSQNVPTAEIAVDKTKTDQTPSRIDEAREKRRQEIKKGNVFGMPGDL